MTLVEVIVIVSLSVLLSAIVFNFAQQFYQNHADLTEQTEEVDSARRGVNRLTIDLREMTYAENGTFPVARIDPHRISFYSDVEGDNAVEYIDYQVVGTTLVRRTHAPTGFPPVYNYTTPDKIETLSTFVQNSARATSTFFYFDRDGNALDAGDLLTDVRYITAQIIVDLNSPRSTEEFILRTGVAPRNIKDNL